MKTITLEFLNSLVQLHTLPRAEWKGRLVYHPMGGQLGTTPYWRYCDIPKGSILRLEPTAEDRAASDFDPRKWEDYSNDSLIYDVGIVTEFKRSPWDLPEDAKDAWDVRFQTGPESFLTYNAFWLWTRP